MSFFGRLYFDIFRRNNALGKLLEKFAVCFFLSHERISFQTFRRVLCELISTTVVLARITRAVFFGANSETDIQSCILLTLPA